VERLKKTIINEALPMKKILTLLLFLFPVSFLYPQENIQQGEEGYLSINTGVQFQNDQSSGQRIWEIPFFLRGAAPYHDIVSTLYLTPELLHLSNWYSANSSRFPTGGVFRYSLASFAVDYQVFAKKVFQINIGGEIGHQGFLRNDFTRPLFQIYIAPTLRNYLFIGRYLMLQAEGTLPLAIYQPGIDNGFYFRARADLTLDIFGSIRNPQKGSTMITIRLEYNYTKMEQKMETINSHLTTPSMFISILF